jgi:hypothetical protein
MKTACCNVLALLALSAVPVHAEECKPVHADLVEVFSTEGCNPGLTYCYLGVVDGNHGLRGTTHFRGNSSGTAPSGAPDAVPYAGPFEYRTASGNLLMREAGIVPPGVVTAYQRILEGTGEFAGATGYFFVSGTRAGGVITTKVTGEICLP